MHNQQRINEILEHFSNWAMPWTYILETYARAGLTVQETAVIKSIWEEANAPAHWVEPSFQSNELLMTAALKEKYSWLSERAIRNLYNGASYMWK